MEYKSNFPESRYLHCHNVGLRMANYAKTKLNKDDDYCQDMFILGCLHDIGYELNQNAIGHDIVMSNILSRCGYTYAKEIKFHSYMQDEYITPEMKLLYFGDLTVDGRGNWCTYKERLDDLAKRYGINSEVYKESEDIVNKLIEWGFDDTVGIEHANKFDVNELFFDLLRGIGVELCSAGCNEFGLKGIATIEDMWPTAAADDIVESLDTFVYDYMYKDMINELRAAEITVPNDCEILEDLYSECLLPLTKSQDPSAVKFCKDHAMDIALFDLIVNRINEVNLSTVYRLQNEQTAIFS